MQVLCRYVMMLVVLIDIIMSKLYQYHCLLMQTPYALTSSCSIWELWISCISMNCFTLYTFWQEELFAVLCRYVMLTVFIDIITSKLYQMHCLLTNLHHTIISSMYYLRILSILRFLWLVVLCIHFGQRNCFQSMNMHFMLVVLIEIIMGKL